MAATLLESAPAAAPDGSARRPRPRAWRTRSVLALVAAVPYLASLANELVWDDRLHLVGYRRTSGLWEALAQFMAPEGVYHRPLVFLTFGIENGLGGSAVLFHLTNVLLHVANALLLFEVAQRTGVSFFAAAFASALFALHPLQVDAVAYVSGRTDLLMTAAALAAMGIVVGAGAGARGSVLTRGLLAALATGVAILSKETGYALAVLLPWLAWRHAPIRGEALTLAGPSVIVAALLLLTRPLVLPLTLTPDPLSTLAAVGSTAVEYARLLVWPDVLQVDRLVPAPVDAARFTYAAVAVVGIVALGYGSSRRGAVGDWVAWSAALYLPASNAIPLYAEIAARALFVPEHNLYAPLAGLAVLVTLALEWGFLRLPQMAQLAGLAAGAVLVVACANRTSARVNDWHDEVTLFSSAAEAGSTSPRVWYNLGNALMATAEDRPNAVFAFREAARLAPNDAGIWGNLGVALQVQRQLDESRSAYARALELAPSALIYENLGTLELARGDRAAAREAFSRALELDPTRFKARQALSGPLGEPQMNAEEHR